MENKDVLDNCQTEAEKLAIEATANYHLRYIHKRLSEDTANQVAQILTKTKRKSNWTLGEVKKIWDSVYNGNDVTLVVESDEKKEPQEGVNG